MTADPIEFRYAARSDVGLTRKNNQDSGYAGPNLLVLADGMGGPAGGDIASSVAIAHLVPLDDESHSADQMIPLLRRAIFDAHDELTDRSRREPALEGLGTTCIAVLRSGNKLAMVHIGDSRAYLLREAVLTQVTADHSFVQYLVDTGQITAQEAETHPQRNVVLRILGDTNADVTPDETVREAVLGDRWLLCSDGLSGVVSHETIESVLNEFEDPGECAEELIRLALRGGGPDNITCVIADIVPAGTSGLSSPQIVGAAARDRSNPTRGGAGAAAKAAALTPTPRAEESDEDKDDPEKSRFRWWIPLVVLIVLAALAVGGWFGYRWSQTQYYVLGKTELHENVVIYQGIPQSLVGVEFSHVVEVTDVPLTSLSVVERERLREPVVRSSREEVDEYVEGLRESSKNKAEDDDMPSSGVSPSQEPSSTESPTSTPSSSVSAESL